MCQERQELGGPAGQLVSREAKGRESSSEAISELLDDMMLQQSVEREMERQNNKLGYIYVYVHVHVCVPQLLYNVRSMYTCTMYNVYHIVS